MWNLNAPIPLAYEGEASSLSSEKVLFELVWPLLSYLTRVGWAGFNFVYIVV